MDNKKDDLPNENISEKNDKSSKSFWQKLKGEVLRGLWGIPSDAIKALGKWILIALVVFIASFFGVRHLLYSATQFTSDKPSTSSPSNNESKEKKVQAQNPPQVSNSENSKQKPPVDLPSDSAPKAKNNKKKLFAPAQQNKVGQITTAPCSQAIVGNNNQQNSTNCTFTVTYGNLKSECSRLAGQIRAYETTRLSLKPKSNTSDPQYQDDFYTWTFNNKKTFDFYFEKNLRRIVAQLKQSNVLAIKLFDAVDAMDERFQDGKRMGYDQSRNFMLLGTYFGLDLNQIDVIADGLEEAANLIPDPR